MPLSHPDPAQGRPFPHRRPGWRPRCLRLGALAVVLGLAAGCDDYPKDPSGTYESVRGGTLTVGYLPQPAMGRRGRRGAAGNRG